MMIFEITKMASSTMNAINLLFWVAKKTTMKGRMIFLRSVKPW